jgi:hypothetical protein
MQVAPMMQRQKENGAPFMGRAVFFCSKQQRLS